MSDLDLITISSGEMTARLNPYGAELWSLVDSQGREYMTAAAPGFWAGHAPLLFPIVGSLNDNHYCIRGKEYTLPRHGFARRSTFEVAIAEPERVMFTLRSSPETLEAYPFEFELNINYRLNGSKLTIGVGVRNCGKVPMPFSFGFHPAFAWPLPGGAAKSDHVIAFSEDEPQRIRRLDRETGLVLAEKHPSPVKGRSFVPRQDMFEADAMIWDSLSSRCVTFGAPGGNQVVVKFPSFPMLGIWQDPGADFLCIEPWQGIADPAGYNGEFRDKPGVIEVAAGGTEFLEMHIAVLLAD